MRSRYIPLLSVSMLLQSGAALQPLSPYSSSAHQEIRQSNLFCHLEEVFSRRLHWRPWVS